MWNDKRILASIREGSDEGIIALYKLYRTEFLGWARKVFSLGEDLAADAFQEAILAVRHNVATGKYNADATLKTYLFTIGKNQIMRRHRKESREIKQSTLDPYRSSDESFQEPSERQIRIRNAMQQMTEPCKSIIKMYYYQGFSMQIIATRLDYKNAQVVKSQKVRCMDQLKKLALGSKL